MLNTSLMWHDLGRIAPGAYEWLYFDVMNAEDGTHVSIDFLAPNPFDPRVMDPAVSATDRVGVIACVSRPGTAGVEIATADTGADLRFDGESLAIGASRVERRCRRGGLPVYELTVDVRSANAPELSLRGTLVFESVSPEWSIPDGGEYYRGRADPSLYHRWVVHAPRADARGQLTLTGADGTLELSIRGHGYHDHNFGTVPLAATVQSWFWARGSNAERTVIAAHLEPRETARGDDWLQDVIYVGASGRTIAAAVGNACRTEATNPAVGGKDVPYARRVSFDTTTRAGAPVSMVFDHASMAISAHPFYLRRFVDLSLGVKGEAPQRFAAVAEDIIFP